MAVIATGCGGEDSSGESRPSFAVKPGTVPGFDWAKSDYVVRCDGSPVFLSIEGSEGWTARVSGEVSREGSYETEHPLRPGEALAVSFKRGETTRKFNVRCLPENFPEFAVTGPWKETPRLTLIQLKGRYAVALDRNGTPVWWLRTPEGDPGDSKFLPDGTFAYAPVRGIKVRHYVLRSLNGRKLRPITAGNRVGTDSHDLQLLPNGNYLIGAHRMVRGVDTKSFGGARRSVIDTTQVQEITPGGKVVWSWNAYPRVGLRETGRWWKVLAAQDQPFDIHHWNSIARRGNQIMLSFRHLDAVYLIDRRTGEIIWKLGGRPTGKSLKVLKDPRAEYPLGGQHDARFMPDGTITILDNATNLKPGQPRAVRYRIDPARRTATLVEEITDPQVPLSVGFGSARLHDGSWMIGWGAMTDGVAGGYETAGGTPSRFLTPGGASYRANPVYGPVPTVARLRKAMNQMARPGG